MNIHHIGKIHLLLQVNCLERVCGFTGMEADSVRKYKPKNPNQQWRFPLAILQHPGILQVSWCMTFISFKMVMRSGIDILVNYEKRLSF